MNRSIESNPNRFAGFIQAGTLWLLLCLGIGGTLIGRGVVRSLAPPPGLAPAALENPVPSHWKHEAIAEVSVGQRVVTPETIPGVAMETAVDPATWKLLKLMIDIPARDGAPADQAEIQTLQSPAWIAENHAIIGGLVPTPLDLREMGMEQEAAEVVAIEPCPPIKTGPGRVVLTTVNHLNQFLFDLTVSDASGHRETIGVTGWHKIYSESRDGWVSASLLTNGELLRGHDGLVTVVSLTRRSGTFRVYNMTVEREHVYYVSSLDALSHNVFCAKIIADAKALSLANQLKLSKDVQRALLRDALQSSGTGKIAHHIIPLEAESQCANILKKGAEGGFDMNGVVNGIASTP